jgi:DNA invertase Pin-like site-specific DNA recombinase
MRKAALYLRVSTDRQTAANQERELREAAARMKCEIVAVFADNGVSGAKGRDRRPQFDALLKAATKRQFDVVMAWSVDRLSRSVQDLCGFLGEIHALGIDLYLHRQGIDTTTPMGKAMFQIAGVFAELERSVIRERINAGLARARTQGTKSGKPIGRPRVPAKTEAAIAKALRKGDQGIHKIAAAHSVGVGVVQRIKAGLAAH